MQKIVELILKKYIKEYMKSTWMNSKA